MLVINEYTAFEYTITNLFDTRGEEHGNKGTQGDIKTLLEMELMKFLDTTKKRTPREAAKDDTSDTGVVEEV